MMDADSELRVLRARVEALEEGLARLAVDEGLTGAARVAVTVSAGSYPTGSGAMKMFAVRGVDVTGTEAEGVVGTETTDSAVFYAVNVGTGLPPVGTKLIVTQVPNLWAFRYP